MLGLIGIGNILGRFALAGLGDRADRLRLLGLCTLGMAVALIFWLAVTNAVMLAIFAVAFGACCGGSIALYPMITGDRFGIAHLGSIIGTLYVAVGVAALIGPSLAGAPFRCLAQLRGSDRCERSLRLRLGLLDLRRVGRGGMMSDRAGRCDPFSRLAILSEKRNLLLAIARHQLRTHLSASVVRSPPSRGNWKIAPSGTRPAKRAGKRLA